MRALPLLLSLPLLAGCPKAKPTFADLARHEVKKLSSWTKEAALPLDQRVFEAPPKLVEYLTMDNQVNGFSGEPKSAPLTPELRAEITHSLSELPPKLKELLSKKLLGVFVATGIGSSAYTDYVRDDKQRPVAAFVVLGVDAMGRKANEWITWKENSPFLADPSMRLEATIEDADHDTRQNALEFVLVHEFGHVLAFDSDVHPLWSVAADKIDVEDYPFMSLSWEVDGNRYARRIEKTLKLPGALVYYKPSTERPSARQMPDYYDWLAKGDFVTLYGATNPYDDFAESLVTYVHTQLMKKPYSIKIFKDGKLERTVPACWEEPRCAKKRKELESFLND